MADWPQEALEVLAEGRPVALITLLAVEGSTPREAGTRMLAWACGAWGTIGGGHLEQLATDQARRMLERPGAPVFAVQDYPLGPLLAQCCGGRVRLLIERLDECDQAWLAEADRLIRANRPFEVVQRLGLPGRTVRPAEPDGDRQMRVDGAPAAARGSKPEAGAEVVWRSAPAQPSLVMFGAGHVGLAIARAFAPLPFRLRWLDCREAARGVAGVEVLPDETLIEIAGRPADFALILTHDHALDYALTAAALRAGGRGYLGLIGSKTKRARFLSRLAADGLGEAARARLVCPIGLPQLSGKAPEIIAASVAADLLLRLQARRAEAAKEDALASL